MGNLRRRHTRWTFCHAYSRRWKMFIHMLGIKIDQESGMDYVSWRDLADGINSAVFLATLTLFSLPCVRTSLCGLAHPHNRITPNYNEQLGLQRESSGLTFPASRTCAGQELEKGLPPLNTLDTNCLDFYL
ncbi:hypothetical protein AMECASPLE_011329 [Ameca splendens]|uniref:Uncharacterized protein n=1 Tax=Ameca splendens TaxID=208324 RepID=A0ABV0YYN1_9TELE